MNIEQTILSACFYPEAVHDITAQVSPHDFTGETHRAIFESIIKLSSDGVTPDPVALNADNNKLSLDYLMELGELLPGVSNLSYYLDKFNTYTERNRFKHLARQLGTMERPEEMRAAIETALETKQATRSEHIGQPLKRAFDKMEEAYKHKGITGIPTGIDKIDVELSGLHKSDMILLAARPSIGKTALALQVAEHACISHKTPTLFISMEMSSDQLASRMVLSRSKINVSKARNGLFEDHEWPRLTSSAADMNEAKLYIDDQCGITVDTITAKAKAAKMRHNIGFLVIDYLGLVTGSGTEYEKITAASQKIKTLAKQLDIPVLCVHQLNRNAANSRPTMNELRSSGQLEQDADVIILLHRDKKEPVEECELIIEKNRHGKTGIIPQQWNGPINRIEGAYDYA